MKNQLLSVLVVLSITANLCLNAAAPPKPRKGSPEFERMKTLVGDWRGKIDMGQGPREMNVSFRVLAGGSALEERVFAGTPNEMTTMYYDQGGKLALTHYCTFGNRPTMLLKSADQKSIEFDFDATCGIDPKKEPHMHTLKIVFHHQNKITTDWKVIMEGKEMPMQPCQLTRVK